MKQTLLLLLFTNMLLSKSISRSQVIMGTFSTITLKKQHQQEIQKGFKLLKLIESSLSSYDKNAKVYQLNHQKSVMADTYLLEILKKSKQIHKESKGYFDISIGSITKKLYHFGEEEKTPTRKQLNDATIDFNGIQEENGTITVKEGITIDLGGIGKGYGVDKVSDYFNEQNITQGKVTLSGDIRCLDICTFHIQSPFEENQVLMGFKSKISNLSISTSGTYRRYIKKKSQHHLINPKNKRQGRAFISATILTNSDNTKADAIATTVSVMPKAKALKFLKEQEVGFILVEPNGNIIQGNLEMFVTLYKI